MSGIPHLKEHECNVEMTITLIAAAKALDKSLESFIVCRASVPATHEKVHVWLLWSYSCDGIQEWCPLWRCCAIGLVRNRTRGRFKSNQSSTHAMREWSYRIVVDV